MKKLLALVLAITAIVTFLPACRDNGDGQGSTGNTDNTGNTGNTDNYTVKVGSLKGPTSIGMVKLMNDCSEGNAALDCEFTVEAAADALTPKLVKDELDIVSIPANLAAILSANSKADIKILAVNTLGVIYIVNNGTSVDSLEDLRGKTVYATGKGQVPEYALTYLLKEKGMTVGEDVSIEWKSEPTEIVALMKQNSDVVAMLPQPYVTVLCNAVSDARIAVDLTAEWDKLNNGSRLITSVIAARSAFIDEHPELVKTFLDEFAKSADYVVNNVDSAAEMVGKFNIVDAAVAKKAIPHCNITCMTGDGMKSALEGYFKVLFEQNPASLGGKLPDGGIYYNVGQ